jgi:putative endopeptidase
MTVLPGDDFFAYANGDWLAKTEIPADRGSWSAMGALAEDQRPHRQDDRDLGADKKPAAKRARWPTSTPPTWTKPASRRGGLAPIKPMLAKIEAIKDKAALVRALGASMRADVDAAQQHQLLHRKPVRPVGRAGPERPVAQHALPAAGRPGHAGPRLLPDDNARMADLRTKYQQHIAAMLKLAGLPTPTRAPPRCSRSRRDRQVARHPRRFGRHPEGEQHLDPEGLRAKAPGMDWNAFFKAAGLGARTASSSGIRAR